VRKKKQTSAKIAIRLKITAFVALRVVRSWSMVLTDMQSPNDLCAAALR
jgi:hypothetical protein